MRPYQQSLARQGLALFLSWCLILVGARNGFAYQDSTLVSQAPPQAAQQSPEQLQQLVAPIALYPDALIAQILPAATYPAEVVAAQQWMVQHKDLTGEALAAEVDKQSWDPSVKALTQFPAVLANMNQNLAWTSELGDVYANQQQDLTNSIQAMRQRARQAGNLTTTPQEKVLSKGQSIEIQPAAPDVVYVPQYDPWLVYGDPLAVFPGWDPYPGLFWDGPGIGFGLGFGIGFFGGFGWGWHNWGFDWRRGGRVVYNHNTYFSHSRTIVNRRGFNRGGGFGGHQGIGGREGLGGHEGIGGRGGIGNSRAATGTHSGAFSGFDHGGMARTNSFRGQSSFGGFHGGGGGFRGAGGGGSFHGAGGGGGFHGGGGGHR